MSILSVAGVPQEHAGSPFRSNFFIFMQFLAKSVADPGFPRGGGANIRISQKLHEIERIWTPGGARPLRPPLDPPLKTFMF